MAVPKSCVTEFTVATAELSVFSPAVMDWYAPDSRSAVVRRFAKSV